jgi:hypothetical protein
MANLGADAGLLLLMDYHYWPVYAGDATRWYCDFTFAVSPWRWSNGSIATWNAYARVRKGCLIAQQVYQYDGLTKQASAAKKPIVSPLNDYYIDSSGTLVASDLEDRNPHPEADMSALDSIIVL